MIKRHKFIVRFHIEADRELMQAMQWYAERSITIANRFLDDVEDAIERIVEGPLRWPKHRQGNRQYILRRFPYSIVYRQTVDAIEIIAVAHAKRRPG